MAQKRKKKRRKKRPAAIQTGDLPAVGEKYLTKGQFSEAIKIFRRLHKESGEERWSELLLTAFTGRISQLTAKGMHKEALVIYGNMESVFPDRNPNPHLHIYLLVNTGRFQEAVEVYGTAAGTLTRKQKLAIDELLAALLLSGQQMLLEVLPEDSALRLQYPHVNRALQAYCLKQDADALESLQNIPFRSPYKNLSLALKGMVVFHTQRDEALSFFEKIDRTSPFLQITVPYRHLITEHCEQAGKLSAPDRQVIQSLEGLDKNTIRFLDSLNTRGKTPSALYQYLVTSGKCLGKKRLRQLCYRLLPHAPEKFPDFLRRFGGITDRFDVYRLQALAMEIEDEYYGIAQAWQEACDELIRKNDPENHLKIALIYRHIAEVMEKDGGEYRPDEIQVQLDKSLKYDPGDKETYLKLVHLQRNDIARQYKLINKMLEEFPGDTDILLLGAEAAVRRGAFKKASRLAAVLLEIDPINTKIRRLLIDAHLGHAHKLAGQRKYELACRECGEAASLDRTDLGRGKIEICHGLLVLLSDDVSRGMKLLGEGESKAESLLLAHFRIRMEAELLDMPQKWANSFTAQLKTTVKPALDKTALLQLVDTIAGCNGKKHVALQAFRATLTPCLKKGARLDLSKENVLTACRAFHRRHYHDLLLVYATIAVKHWPEVPLFRFYHLYAKTAGGKKRLSRKQYEQLDEAWNTAMNQGDKAAADLIDEFLMKNSPFTGSMDDGAFQQFAAFINEKFAHHLAEGTEPTDEEINRFLSEMVHPGSLPDELNPPPRILERQTPKTGDGPRKKTGG